MYRLLILINCIFVIAKTANAQQAFKSHVQEFTTENGMPSNGIKGLQWDETTNFLWIATEAGIVRYNGVDFRNFTKENLPSITSERMLFMTRNNRGSIYVSDLTGNIFLIDKNKPVLWKKGSENINPYFSNYYLLPVSDRFFNEHSAEQKNLRFSAVLDQIVSLSDTACLILKAGTLYYQSISLKMPVLHSLDKMHFNSLYKIDNAVFLSNSKRETFLLNTSTNSLTSIPIENEKGVIIIPTAENNFFYWGTGMKNPILITENKAWLLTFDGKKITAKLLFSEIPPYALLRYIQYSEKNKMLFLGTDSKGLIVMKQNKVQIERRGNGNTKNRNSYYSQIELADGNILTSEGDIIGNNPISKKPLPINGKFSYNITNTNDSLLWYTQPNPLLGTSNLHRYNYVTGETKDFKKIIWEDIIASSRNAIYAVNSVGIGIIEEDSLRYLHKFAINYFSNTNFDFKEISPGVLAIASCNGLLTFNTSTYKLDTIFKKENICVRNIWKYEDYLFFGTYGSGFYIYKDGVLKSLPLDKNKYLLYTHCIMPDDEGFCWISTNRGLFKTSLAELLNYFDNKTKFVYYHYFGKEDGMDMTELNGGCTPCALRLKNNILSFPTMDGLLWVNPEKAIPILPAGEIYIDQIQVDSTILNADSVTNLQLPSQTKEIIVSLGYSAWSNKENIYLDYQLNDTINWKSINTNLDNDIRLNNLPSGKYVLRIRKINGFGNNNFSYKELHFTILTPWNKQGWFYLVCLMLAMGMVAFYLHLRTRQYSIRQSKLEKQVTEKTKELQEKNEALEKNNTIKTRLISIISHDIVTPLKFVTGAGKNLIEKRNLMSEELQKETIQEMTNTSQELHLLSTNILNWIKYQNENRRLVKEMFNVHELINQVFGVLRSLAKQKNLLLVNNTNTNLEIRQFFEPLKILIYNLFTNAINFSENGSITISAQTGTDYITITVTDKGVGMSPEQIKNIMADQFIISSANIDNRKGNGLGYLIIKDLVKMMDATLNISSQKGYGSSVAVILPISKKTTGNNESQT